MEAFTVELVLHSLERLFSGPFAHAWEVNILIETFKKSKMHCFWSVWQLMDLGVWCGLREGCAHLSQCVKLLGYDKVARLAYEPELRLRCCRSAFSLSQTILGFINPQNTEYICPNVTWFCLPLQPECFSHQSEGRRKAGGAGLFGKTIAG